MTEQEYVVNTFYENFSSHRDQNIALYGLGIHSRTIIEAFPDFKLNALLDGYRNDGEMYGKPILPLESLVDLGIHMVIIVARAASVKIIYKRIAQFCTANGIRVYDMRGKELTEDNNEIHDLKDEFNISIDDAKLAIREHEIISFDIFNTLLARKTYLPQDVYYMVQKRCDIREIDFVKERTLAERELAEANPTLDQIYKSIQNKTGILATVISDLMQAEIKIEKEVLICRESMKDLLNYALSLGKQVYLISDMYLSKSILQGILTEHEIVGYRDIFVSCDYHTSKRQELYQVFKSQIKGASYLHLGDDDEVDGTCAKLNGLDYLIIHSTSEMLAKSSFRPLLEMADTHENHMVMGLMAANLLNDPFSLYRSGGKPVVHSASQLGYVFIAPILGSFVLWLMEALKGKNYSRILFLARDGYLIKQIYDEAVKIMGCQGLLPESVYFLTSRQAGISATATTDDQIRYAAGLAFNGTPKELLRKRFLLSEDEIAQYKEDDYATLEEYYLYHAHQIKSQAKKLSSNHLRYIKDLYIKEDENLAFFDFASSGTCHMCVEELLGKKMDGYYFMRMTEEYYKKKQLSIVSYYNDHNQKSSFGENYFFLESIIKSLEPSILHFDEEGNPLYQQESRGKEQIEFIKEVQKGTTDFLREFFHRMRGAQVHIDKSYADKTLELMQSKYTAMNISNLEHSVIRDEFCNRNIDLSTYLA